jgi:hypothetical protein
MEEYEKENLFITLDGLLKSIIEDKRKNPKNLKNINNYKARINVGYQIDKDFYFWCNLMAENGNYKLSRGKLDDYDLVIKVTPEDALFFHNGEYSILHMMTKKNRFGYRKLRTEKGSDGKRNLGILLKFPKIFVLDKLKTK